MIIVTLMFFIGAIYRNIFVIVIYSNSRLIDGSYSHGVDIGHSFVLQNKPQNGLQYFLHANQRLIIIVERDPDKMVHIVESYNDTAVGGVCGLSLVSHVDDRSESIGAFLGEQSGERRKR